MDGGRERGREGEREGGREDVFTHWCKGSLQTSALHLNCKYFARWRESTFYVQQHIPPLLFQTCSLLVFLC